MKPDTCDIIPDVLDPFKENAVIFAGNISHLRNFLSSSHAENSGEFSSLSDLTGALGMTEAELSEMCRTK